LNTPVPLTTTLLPEDEEAPIIELPAFNCGDTYVPEDLTNQELIDDLSENDMVAINGFPMLLQSVDKSGDTYFGQAVIPLPFNKQVVKVQYEIQVNTDKRVVALNIGGDICVPPVQEENNGTNGPKAVSGLDGYGFNEETGLHEGTRSPYDRGGFDINGNHKDTGTPYNSPDEDGCSRDGETRSGEKCDPTGGAVPEAGEFADSVKTSLPNTATELINDLVVEIAKSLDSIFWRK